MEGRLRNESLSIEIESSCGHCGKRIGLTVGADLQLHVHQPDAHPIVFEPSIDWTTFREPNILHAY